MYVRVGTKEQLVNDRAEKQVVVDGLDSASNEKMGQGDALIRKDLCSPSK